MGWLLFSTILIFSAWLVYRRRQERSLKDLLEYLKKLGKVEVIRTKSSFILGPTLLELKLRPEAELIQERRAAEGELKVVWAAKKPEMISLSVSPHSVFKFPKFFPGEIMGKEEWYELRPIVAQHSGVWRLARVEDEREVLGNRKGKRRTRVLSTRDHLVTGERVGVIVRRAWLRESEVHHYYALSQGYPLSLQVSDGTEVNPGDILVIMAVPTGRKLDEEPR